MSTLLSRYGRSLAYFDYSAGDQKSGKGIPGDAVSCVALLSLLLQKLPYLGGFLARCCLKQDYVPRKIVCGRSPVGRADYSYLRDAVWYLSLADRPMR